MVEEKDYTKILPTEPPEGMIEWLKSIGCLKSEGIIYRSAYIIHPLTGLKTKMVECKCTACGETFYQEYSAAPCCSQCYAPAPFGFIHSQTNEHLISGNDTLCPQCGAEVKLYHCGTMKYNKKVDEVYPMSVHMIDGKLALIGWFIQKNIIHDGTTHISSSIYEAYVFEGRKATKLVGYRRFMSSISYSIDWKQLKKCSDTWGQRNNAYTFPWDASILNGTEFENCKLDMYMQGEKTYPVKYMRIWQKHKNVENIVMQGASNILNDMIEAEHTYYSYYGYRTKTTTNVTGIDWKKKRPSAMLGLNREEFKAAVSHKWGLEALNFYRKAKAYNIRIEDVDMCKKFKFSEVESLFEQDKSIMRTLRYLEKQKEKHPAYAHAIGVGYITDYWEMAAENGADITNPDIKYPQSIVNAHNGAMREKHWKQDKKLIKKFTERYEVLSKFCYSSELFEIRPPINEKEMLFEGKCLDHCVANYAKRHAEGSTAIFFIRTVEQPDEPYYTLELDEKNIQVRQNRGYKNCGKTPEVQAFEDEWLEFVKKVIQEDKENGKSDHTAA